MNRYVVVPCIINARGRIIPFWNSNLSFEEKEESFSVNFDGSEYQNQKFKDCLFDLKTKKLSQFKTISLKPKEFEVFKEEEVVYRRTVDGLVEDKIKKIHSGTTNFFQVKLGNELSTLEKLAFEDGWEDVEENTLYLIKSYKPIWFFESHYQTTDINNIYKKANA